jgi:hypothetical protein
VWAGGWRAYHESMLYALACVLYQSLTGQLPFPVRSLEQIAVAHLLQPPPRPSMTQNGVPAAMDHVIATGMAKDAVLSPQLTRTGAVSGNKVRRGSTFTV